MSCWQPWEPDGGPDVFPIIPVSYTHLDYNDSGWTIPDQMEKYGNSPWGSGVSPNAENAFAATVVRKEFEAKKEIAGAHAYVSGLGFFEMKINGRLPDDTLMNVANTQYTQTASYRAFDVTDLVKQGKNAIGVELGNNFYNETCSVWNLSLIHI